MHEARGDPAFCLSYLAHSCLFVNNLARNGSHEQKAKLLPKACSGELIGRMGMSEPHAGTDVLGMGTRATKLADGSWSLTGAKMWITNGAVSDTELGDAFLVYARTGGPEVKPSKAISLFLVEKGTPGFSLGQRLKDKCGMRVPNGGRLLRRLHHPRVEHGGRRGRRHDLYDAQPRDGARRPGGDGGRPGAALTSP